MGGHSIFQHLRQITPEAAQTLVTRALCQTPEIWQGLQDAAFPQHVFQHLTADPKQWTAGRLVLRALEINGYPPKPEETIESNVDSRLLRKAKQAAENFYQNGDGDLTASERFQQAGLIAVYLLDRHLKEESWESILAESIQRKTGSILDWKIVSTILYSLASDKMELLQAIIRISPTFESHALALNTLLSQPSPLTEHREILIKLAQDHGDWIKAEWVQEWLSINSPELASMYARWLLEQDRPPARASYFGQVGSLLAEISALGWQAYLHGQSNESIEALDLLEQAGKQTRWLVSEIASSWASQAEQLSSDCANPEDISAAWEQALLSAPVTEEDRRHLPYFQEYLKSQLRHGVLPEIFLNGNAWQAEGFDGSTLFELARHKLSTGNISEAISIARQALVKMSDVDNSTYLDEKSRQVLLTGSALLLELDMPDEAVRTARRIILASPSDYVAQQILGRAYLKLGDLKNALEALEVSFLLAPDQLDIHRLLASALEKSQDWETALFERNEIVRQSGVTSPADLKVDLHDLANCAYHAGALQQALETCTQSLGIDESDWQAHHILGKVFQDLGDTNQASQHFSQAIQADPQQIDPWLRLAAIYERDNQVDNALTTLNTAIQANPQSPELYLAIGKVLLSQNSLTQAQNAFQSAYDLTIKQPVTYQAVICDSGSNLSKVLTRLGHFDESRAIITPIYQAHPDDPSVARIYAQMMSATQNFAAAITPLELCLSIQPADPELTFEYGKALIALRREPEKALNALQNTLDHVPGHLEAQALLAEATAATGLHDQALDMFRSALESELGKDSLWQSRLSMDLGLSALALGRNETALAALQQAIQLDPQNAVAQQALAEAFITVGMQNEGWLTAQTTLRLDPSQNTTIWFADLALAWFKNDISQTKTTPHSTSITPAIRFRPDQILQEASIALRQALKIYPADSRLMVKLSQIYIQAGDYRSARACLRDIANLTSPTIEALESSASMLMELKDPAAAAECLEKVIKITPDDSPETLAERHSRLAKAREQAGHIASAIQALEQALLIIPDRAEYYQRLVDLWITMGNIDRALETMDRARKHVNEPLILVELLATTSLLCRKAGRLLASLNYAGQAVHTCSELPPSVQSNSLLEKTSALYAELCWVLLRPEEAQHAMRGIFRSQHNSSENYTDSSLDYYCLGAELALQFNEEVEAANYLTQALDMAPEHPWPLAIQARLLHKQKDQPLAVSTLQEAIDRSKHEKLPVMALISLANAATELTEWQTALDVLRRAVVMAPDEPLPQLSLAQVIVLRGEFQILCEDLDVIKHAPGRDALSLESQKEYLNALQSAETNLVQAYQEDSSSPKPSNTEQPEKLESWNKAFTHIARWKCRGAALFGGLGVQSTVPASWCSWNGFPMHTKDEAAHLAFLRQSSTPEKSNRSMVAIAREYAVLHPQDPEIQIQASLVLAPTNLSEALRYARSATNQLSSLPKHPLTALAHVLVAHLASRSGDIASAAQSIQIALGIWTEEARWHNLSARIYLNDLQQKVSSGSDASDVLEKAVAHLEEALRLEPDRASHAILLSQIIFQTASQDPIATKRALRILEKTSRLAGNEPEIWLALASAYQQSGGKTNLKLAYASAERAIVVAREGNSRQTLVEAHVQLGQMALTNGEPEEAYRQARQALRIDAHNADATLLQVHALEALNRTEDALDVIEKALPSNQDNLILQVKRGALLSQGVDPTAGIATLENLASQHPTHPAVHSELAKNLYRNGRKEDAIQHAQQAIQLSNKGEVPLEAQELGDMHTLLGNLYNELGHLDQAIFQFNTALQQFPDQIEAYLALADTYHKQRQFLKAQDVLEQAIHTAPTDYRPYFQAGMAYKDGRNYEAAASMLRKAAQLSPNDINIRKQLAAVMAIVVLNNTRNLGNKVADEVR